MPRKGLPALPHRLFERFDHAGNVDEPLAAIGEGADAGQHDALGLRAPPRARTSL